MSSAAALLIDFGSTYTKLRAVDLDTCRLLGSGQGPSTVTSDITIGMQAALNDLEERIGKLPDFTYRLASSSAAGGLKMVTVGLVKELTAEAARLAALGAGACLADTFAYALARRDVEQIVAQEPDILLLAGGTDGGNSQVILHNADMLAHASAQCPIVVAGNRAVADEVEDILKTAGKDVRVTANVMPALGMLDIEPARAAIREVFIDRIVHAKGFDQAQQFFGTVLMPTPAAALEAAKLLSEGTDNRQGVGPLMLVDIGGATTDVHSVASGEVGEGRVMQQGIPEPYLKRTVEGDLGMRHSAAAVVEAAGREEIATLAGITACQVDIMLETIASNVERLPETPAEKAFDAALAHTAIGIAIQRHAGTVEIVQTVNGAVAVQRGKDLGPVGTVIGTGGALVYGGFASWALSGASYSQEEPHSLRPVDPSVFIDQDYVLYAAGLLAEVEPDVAYELASASLAPAACTQPWEEASELRLTTG